MKGKDESFAIRMYLKPGRASSSDIGELFESLSDLNRACGGYGLDFEVVDPKRYSEEDRGIAEQGFIPVDIVAIGETRESLEKLMGSDFILLRP